MDQGADQPGFGGVEFLHQVFSAGGAVDVFTDTLEYFLDLFIQFYAVGDDKYARIGHVFADPLCEPDHRQAFSAALCMPDDAAFTLTGALLRGFDAKVLVVAGKFFGAGIKHNEIVDDLKQTFFPTELAQLEIERQLSR